MAVFKIGVRQIQALNTFLRSLYLFWALLFFSWCAFCLFVAVSGRGP